jgi:hypothetical protein
MATRPQDRSMALRSRAPQNVREKPCRTARKPCRGGLVARLAMACRRRWRCVLLLVLLGIWVIIRDKDGKEIARIQVPEGASVTQEPIPPLPVPVLEKPEHRPMPAVSEPQPLPPWNLPAGSPAPAVAPFDAAQAKQHQEAWAEHLGVPVEFENSIGMKFVLIPPGEFDMGSTEEEVAKHSGGSQSHEPAELVHRATAVRSSKASRPDHEGVVPGDD